MSCDSDPQDAANERELAVWRALAQVADPELPVLSVVDLGIVREVRWRDGPAPYVRITPTYTGCPASAVIFEAVVQALDRAGFRCARVEQVLFPPWTSDWLSEAGRRKLAAFGIAPPELRGGDGAPPDAAVVRCPRCASPHTQCVSQFGSTPCKAQYRCNACLEPFEHFKCY